MYITWLISFFQTKNAKQMSYHNHNRFPVSAVNRGINLQVIWSVSLTKPMTTTTNRPSVSILSWFNAPMNWLDFSLSSNFGLLWNSRLTPPSAAFFKGTVFWRISSTDRRSHQLVPSPPLFVWISADRCWIFGIRVTTFTLQKRLYFLSCSYSKNTQKAKILPKVTEKRFRQKKKVAHEPKSYSKRCQQLVDRPRIKVKTCSILTNRLHVKMEDSALIQNLIQQVALSSLHDGRSRTFSRAKA